MEDYELQLAKEAGLIYQGKNEDGEDEFLGTKQEWEEFERLTETGV